jgi:hypothetical protein
VTFLLDHVAACVQRKRERGLGGPEERRDT